MNKKGEDNERCKFIDIMKSYASYVAKHNDDRKDIQKRVDNTAVLSTLSISNFSSLILRIIFPF